MILTHFDHLMIYYFAEDGMIKEIKDIDLSNVINGKGKVNSIWLE